MSELVAFSESLRKSRQKNHLTQEQVAELLDVSARWYQEIESGRSAPNFILTCKIVKYFKIDLDACCTEEDHDHYFKIAN